MEKLDIQKGAEESMVKYKPIFDMLEEVITFTVLQMFEDFKKIHGDTLFTIAEAEDLLWRFEHK